VTVVRCRFEASASESRITGNSRELLENEVRPLVEAFLKERGLTLSSDKTHITHIDEELIPSLAPIKSRVFSLTPRFGTVLTQFRGLVSQRASRLRVKGCDGPQLPVEITQICGRSEPAPRRRARPALVPLVPVAHLTEIGAIGLHICKSAASSQPCPYGLSPIERSGVEVMPRN
jgi:hypothetical protein